MTYKYRVAVLTASDKGAKGLREDKSGRLICSIMENSGYNIAHYAVLPDHRQNLREKMAKWCDENTADLIITTGGTGLSPRDCMPEATLDIAERLVPGIAEAIRSFSMQITGRAMLSRAVCVTRKQTLIINLPGSPKAVEESLGYILSHLKHGLDIMTRRDVECARSNQNE